MKSKENSRVYMRSKKKKEHDYFLFFSFFKIKTNDAKRIKCKPGGVGGVGGLKKIKLNFFGA